MKRLVCVFFAGVFAQALVGCEALPGAGPSTSDVLSEAKRDPSQPQRYMIVDVTDSVVHLLAGRVDHQSFASFGVGGASEEPRIGVGDAVVVHIWEAASGGLFSGGPETIRVQGGGSRAAQIPEQVVGRDGMISVPYAGRIRVAGRRPQEVQRLIESALAGKAIQPQVLVSVPKSISSSVTVVGDASGSSRVPLGPRGDRVLDVLASAGSLRTTVIDTVIQLSRNGRTVRVPLSRITSNPQENIFLRAGDVITVMREPQFFLAYGASGRNAEVPLESETVTLSQALSKAGGLLDFRADPQGVFVFRNEPLRIAKQLAGYDGRYGDYGYVKVVYRFNMRDPNSLFLANHFRVFHRDLIYVSNSMLAEASKVLQLFNMITAPVSSGASIASAVR